MKNGLVFALALSFLTMGLTATAFAQTVSVFDTVYVPPGYTDGPGIARMYVPELGNGIGVVLVHGCTGRRTDSRPWCDTLASYGYVAMSIEYPDPCVDSAAIYPQNARAVKLAVEFLRRNAGRFGITTGKIVGWGASNGAWTWGEVIIWDNDDVYFQTDSTIDDHVNAAVLLYGSYDDFESTPYYPYYYHVYFSNDSLRALKGHCMKNVANITTPTLLLHGTSDTSNPYQLSVLLHDSLVARGKVSELVPFNGQSHGFDLDWPTLTFTPAGLVAKDTALAFLRRIVAPQLKIRVNTPSIDFGNVVLTESDTAAVSISNIGFGLSPLSVNVITNTSPQFTLVNLPSFPAIIPAGGTLHFNAAFHPSVQGVSSDTIRIVTDDSLHQLVRITSQGRGVVMRPAHAGVLYATSGAAPEGNLYSMNTSTGELSTIGPMGISEIHGLAIRHADNVIYGSYDSPTATTLYRVNSESGAAAHTRVIPVGNLHAIAFSLGDTLYGATTTGSVYRIDLTTGRADSLGNAFGLAYYGLSFRPRLNQLWASVRTPIDSIFRLNTTTGVPTFVGVTGFNALTNSLAFDLRGNLFGLIDNGSGEDYLANIDTITASGVIIAGPLSVSHLQAIAMRTDSLGIAGVKDLHDKGIPLTFEMHQNYPNPFNPTTNIKFQIPNNGRVTLKVYDVLGREVKTLVNEELKAGGYETTFDANGLATGVYYYRLESGNFVETKKLVLLR